MPSMVCVPRVLVKKLVLCQRGQDRLNLKIARCHGTAVYRCFHDSGTS
jgi:hypothetical protein